MCQPGAAQAAAVVSQPVAAYLKNNIEQLMLQRNINVATHNKINEWPD